MARQSTRPTLEEIQVELNDSDHKVRKEAIKKLMRYQRALAFEPLVKLLEDGRSDVRVKTVQELGKLKDKRALVPLLGLLNDKNASVRASVARILGNFGNHNVSLPLQDLLKDPNARIRQAAATSLGELRAINALPALLDYLERTWPDLSELFVAARAVSKFDVPGVVEPLLALCRRTYHVQETIAEALSMLGETSTPLLLEILADKGRPPEMRCCVARSLYRKARRGSLPVLLQVLSGEEANLRRFAALALCTLGVSDESVSLALISLLSDNEVNVCMAAIQALGELKINFAIEPLIACLAARHDQAIASAAARTLDQLDAQQALPELLLAFDRAEILPDWPLINALIKLGGPELVDPLLERLPSSADQRRWCILFMLWRFPSEKLVEPLLTCLDSATPDLFSGRWPVEIINLLGQVADPRALAPLRTLHARTSGEWHRALTPVIQQLEKISAQQ